MCDFFRSKGGREGVAHLVVAKKRQVAAGRRGVGREPAVARVVASSDSR